MKNLETQLNNVFLAKTLDAKKEAMYSLIDESHGKKETKKLAKTRVSMLKSNSQVDKYATNYMFAGEGYRV
jgi:hypothetical protein